MIFLFYFVFLAAFTIGGTAIGYLVEPRYPGSGTLVTIVIFLIALWAAWAISVRLTEHFWPEPPPAA